jgi:hypothetical protein
MIKHSLMAIDPGLNSMGWAYWKPSARLNGYPTQVGLLHAPRKFELAPRAIWLARRLDEKLDTIGELGGQVGHYEIDFVSEYPAWHGIQLGWAAGDLQKLVFLVGVLAGYFESAHSFTPVTPKEWKGQLPKSVVIRRLQKRFGPDMTDGWEKDVWDAVGIGLWKLGKF